MKKIPLTKGLVALVDDEDYDFLMQWKWHACNGYAMRNTPRDENGRQAKIRMHIVVNKTPPGWLTDHKDLNRCNNQKYNLRNSNYKNNKANMKKCAQPKTSKYKGVSRSGNRWRALIYKGYKKIDLGQHATEIEAARAYNAAAVEHFGEFAQLNQV